MKLVFISMFTLTILIGCNKNTTPTPQNATTVSVCNQVWMTKNLEVSVYRNGDIIP